MMESVNEHETCILYINLKMTNPILELGINKLTVGGCISWESLVVSQPHLEEH